MVKHDNRRLVVILSVLMALAAAAGGPPLRAGTTTRPTLDANLGIDDLIRVMDEPAWGDRSVELYRKRQAIAAISANLPGAAKAIPSLVKLLHDRATGRLAAAALVRLRDQARSEINDAAHDSDPAVRADIAAEVVSTGMDAEPLLTDLSRNDADGAVRAAATKSLVSIGSPQAAPALLAMLRSPNLSDRTAAAQMIDSNPRWLVTDGVAVRLAEFLASPDVPLRQAAAYALVRNPSHPNAVLPLAYQYARTAPDGGAAAMHVVAAYPPTAQSVNVAVRCLGSQNGQTRGYAIDLLRSAGPLVLAELPALANAASWQGQSYAQFGNMRELLFQACSRLPGEGEPCVPPALAPMTADKLLDALLRVANEERYPIGVRAIALEPLSRWGPKAGGAMRTAVTVLRSGAADTQDRLVAITYLANHAPAGFEADTAVADAITRDPEPIADAAEHYIIVNAPASYPMIGRILNSPRESSEIVALRACGQIRKPDAALARVVCQTALHRYGQVRTEALRVLQTWLADHPAPAVVGAIAPDAKRFHQIDHEAGSDPSAIAGILGVIEPPRAPNTASAAHTGSAAPQATVSGAAPSFWAGLQTIAGAVAFLAAMVIGAAVLPRRVLPAGAIVTLSRPAPAPPIPTDPLVPTPGPDGSLVRVTAGSVIVEQSGTKTAHCEQCNREYSYDIRRKVVRRRGGAAIPLGVAGGLLGGLIGALIDSTRGDAISGTLQEKLQRKAKRRVDEEVDVVPCPDCGWHQRSMVAEARRRARFSHRMQVLGALAALSLIAALFLIGLRGDPYTARSIPVTAVWITLGVLAFFLAAYAACWRRAGRLDVNEGWPQTCPQCHSRHARSAQFCRRCGSRFHRGNGTL